MSDPLSITASVVGITVAALHSTRLLLEDLQQLKDAPKTVKRLVEEVHSINIALKLVQDMEDREWEHLEDGKLAWKDRVNVGFFKQAQIKAMSDQVSNCRLTITSSVSIATLYISVRYSHITEEIKKAISTTDDDEAAGSGGSKTETLRQLEGEHKALKVSQKLLNELLSKSQEEAIAKAAGNLSRLTTVTFGNQNSGFQAGIINGGVSGNSFGGK
ncbi:hypothetical protein V498_04838 [Pseudogymnoascus sp. VKM F-4517 (FW-2822)]|nr:hypothetical protein V498_04838 [Pseudogymnoascus sp. VKM F-4517 (FW-2822)]